MSGAAGLSEGTAVGAAVRMDAGIGDRLGATLATPGAGGGTGEGGRAVAEVAGSGGAQPLGNLVDATPAAFAGAVFALFGLGLLVWTAVRARHRRPVYEGAAPVASAAVSALVAVVSLALGLWCFSRI
ncbi:hypothetical protein ACFWMQ_06420 [Streptomyces sp. NPDC058372]|uniref:hypothetical protein n=1 Tax=Streptomyces sp. NPDC058372 TaxID=3346464 RepID=UPI00364A6536